MRMQLKILQPRPNPEQRNATLSVAAVALFAGWVFGLSQTAAFAAGMWAFAVGTAAAVLPVVFYVAVALLIDRYEKEPRWMLAVAFFLGAVVAFVATTQLNPVSGVTAWTPPDVARRLAMAAALKGAWIEELIKAAALLGLFLWQRNEFDNTVDGIIYATMVGLGFAMTENVPKYAAAWVDGTLGSVMFSRGVMSPFSHPMFTALAGMGLGLAQEKENRVVKVAAPLIGVALAVGLHVLWNYLANAVVMLPIFIALIWVVVYQQGRERKLIRLHLAPCVPAGQLSLAELEMLCAWGGRARELWTALRSGGLAELGRRERYHQAATKLAFQRWRISREGSRSSAADAKREKAYLRTIRENRVPRARLAVTGRSAG